MKKVPAVIISCLVLVALVITSFNLFPRGGHLGSETELKVWLIKVIVPAIIATAVILIFRKTSGNISLKLSIPGNFGSLEFSAKQTQGSLWCVVYIVIAAFSPI